MTGDQIRALAGSLGFDLAGIAPAEPTPRMGFLETWLARGHAGEMAWIGRRAAERMDPRKVLEEAQSVIVVGLTYGPEQLSAGDGGDPRDDGDARGRIARYVGTEDYHDVMLERLRELESALQEAADRPLRSRVYVDTGPILERELAARAGLGWIGKNTCLIHPRLGSFVMLGVVLTELLIEPDDPEPDHCGSCRACLDVCPTDAFPEPYVLDASRCISYTTIELRGPIPEALRAGQGNQIFGCDLCQDVCPWNLRRGRRFPPEGAALRKRLAPRKEWDRPKLSWVLELEEETWRGLTRRSALRRSKWRGLLRNALVAAGNSGDASLLPLLERYAEGDDPELAEHARWALNRLTRRPIQRAR